MTEMIERVARALCKSREFAYCDKFCKDGCSGTIKTLGQNGSLDGARAAIAAMLEPTEKMLARFGLDPACRAALVADYTVMIDAALSQESSHV